MVRVILSSGNTNKIKEIKEILSAFDVEIVSKDEIGFGTLEVQEDGDTLEDNAMKKAKELWNHTGGIVIADDTGLFVKSLDGSPGVYSARYAGENASYADNNKLILEEMKNINKENREAYFKTVIVVIDLKGKSHISEGICKGEIAFSPSGTNGFGYDPLFIPEGFSNTFAELTDYEKNSISHRGRAVRGLESIFKEILR